MGKFRLPSAASEWDDVCAWVRDAAGLTVSEAQLARLQVYVDTLRLWNRKMALVSRGDADRVVTRHIADSLFAAAHCADGESIVDLGSGAGFPGLPVAIVRSASRVSLIESRAKKVSFLTEAVRVTGTTNAVVCHARMESAATDPAHHGQYEVAIARALASLDELVAVAGAFLVSSGRVIAMTSPAQATPNTERASRTISYRLPDGAERSLVIIAA